MSENRQLASNTVFHVMNRGNARQQLFFNPWDYRNFLSLIARYKKKFSLKLYHYVLMPNHIHFLLESPTDIGISKFMQGLTLSYACRYNYRAEKTGHVWQGRFKSIPVEEDSYFLQCGQYIEMNPVRAKIVLDPAQYPWSSYAKHALGADDPLVDEHPLYTELGLTPLARMLNYKKSMIQETVQK